MESSASTKQTAADFDVLLRHRPRSISRRGHIHIPLRIESGSRESTSAGGVWKNPATTSEEVIRGYVHATSAADGDAAAAMTADDLVIELPGGAVLKGKEGARQFAAKHAETDGEKRSVTLTSLDALAQDRFVATLVMSNRHVAADELLYSMDVGAVIAVRDGLVTRNQVFPSPDEAAAAAQQTEA